MELELDLGKEPLKKPYLHWNASLCIIKTVFGFGGASFTTSRSIDQKLFSCYCSILIIIIFRVCVNNLHVKAMRVFLMHDVLYNLDKAVVVLLDFLNTVVDVDFLKNVKHSIELLVDLF